MSAEQAAAMMLAPAEGSRLSKRLAGTGTTEDTNTTALPVGNMATLLVGPVAIYVRFLKATGGGTSVAAGTYDVEVPAGGRFDWVVETGNQFVAVEASDGASAYRASLWTSSPKA